MGFNIIAPYMEFLHLNWYIAEWFYYLHGQAHKIHFKHKSPYVAGIWRFPDVLHCQDVEADCLDVLIIFSMGI